jgi:NADPH:quinone reductase-like Zn-dependent oxidoreductase
MRAAVIKAAGGPITVEDRPIRDPGPGEVRIHVIADPADPADIFL